MASKVKKKKTLINRNRGVGGCAWLWDGNSVKSDCYDHYTTTGGDSLGCVGMCLVCGMEIL